MDKVGVYVDVMNITMNGGYRLRFDILRKYASRSGESPMCLNAYLGYEEERLQTDYEYRKKTERFCNTIRDFGYKVIEKPIFTYTNHDTGEKFRKSNIDMDMAVDMIMHSEHLDKIVLLSGSGSYISVVNALQSRGRNVSLVGFDNVSGGLKRAVNTYISGYLIPNMLPIESAYPWGTVGSRVRGVCYDFSHNDGYGFIRYISKLNNNMWLTDSRDPDSPYKTAFAHISDFEDDMDENILPNRDYVFEFDLVENDKGLIAKNIVFINPP